MLTKTLIQALQGDERATDQLCIQFRYIAVAYLRSKAKSKDFLLDHLYKNIDDLALDCIADLFGRSNQCLQSIEAFLTLDQIKEMSESEVQTKVRQLIFSKVNDGLYQNFQKLDPSLSRIIRNLKRTLDEDKVAGLNYDPRSGEIVISGENHSLPNMPDEILEIKISARFSEIKNSVDAIKALAFIIREAEEYSSKIKLVNFAVLLRKVSAYRLENEVENLTLKAGEEYDRTHLKKILTECIATERIHLQKTYVESKKVDKNLFEKYMRATEKILIAEFISALPREGYFEHVEYYLPELDYGRYRAGHRQIFEYIVKKVREQFLARVKKAKNFSNT